MVLAITLQAHPNLITAGSSLRRNRYNHPSTISAKPQLSYECKCPSLSFHRIRRRQVLLSYSFPALLWNSLKFPERAAAAEENNTPRNELIEKLLERSKANKAKYEKERLDDYYKRNYKDYFELVEGSIQNKKGNMSEAEKGILEWLQKNR